MTSKTNKKKTKTYTLTKFGKCLFNTVKRDNNKDRCKLQAVR